MFSFTQSDTCNNITILGNSVGRIFFSVALKIKLVFEKAENSASPTKVLQLTTPYKPAFLKQASSRVCLAMSNFIRFITTDTR